MIKAILLKGITYVILGAAFWIIAIAAAIRALIKGRK